MSKWFKNRILDDNEAGRFPSYSGTSVCHPRGFKGIQVFEGKGVSDRPAIFTRIVKSLETMDRDYWSVYQYPSAEVSEGVFVTWNYYNEDTSTYDTGDMFEISVGEVVGQPSVVSSVAQDVSFSYVILDDQLSGSCDPGGSGYSKGCLHPIDLHRYTVGLAGPNYNIYKDAIPETPTIADDIYDVSGDCSGYCIEDVFFNPKDSLIYIIDGHHGFIQIGFLTPATPSITWVVEITGLSDQDGAYFFTGGGFNWKGDLLFSVNYRDPISSDYSCEIYFVSSASVQAGGPYDASGDMLESFSNMIINRFVCDPKSNDIYFQSIDQDPVFGDLSHSRIFKLPYLTNSHSYDTAVQAIVLPTYHEAISLCASTYLDVGAYLARLAELGG